jgi:hypothetical protein
MDLKSTEVIGKERVGGESMAGRIPLPDVKMI